MRWLLNKWRAFAKDQIDSRERDIEEPLRFEPSAVIRRDLEDLFGTFDGQNAVQWKKAIFFAKLGSTGLSRGGEGLQTAEDRELALTAAEDKALQAEREKLSSQKGILPVVLAVALAAFLQGHVQSSINGASIFADVLGVDRGPENKHELETGWRDWQIGGMNASPFLTAALLGAPAALPTNYYIGRRGSLIVSAVLIIASSLASAFSRNWVDLLGYRIIGGIGMGIKAVSGPVLAAESVTGFWRGSIMITWQLWVACGIMLGLVANIVIAAIADSLDIETTDIVNNPKLHKGAMQFILGAPLIPSVALLVAVYFCYESPRFYMRPEDPSNFNPQEALRILKAIRPTELQAMRDFILIRWSTKLDEDSAKLVSGLEKGLTYASQLSVVTRHSFHQYWTLLKTRRRRNAAISTYTVMLAQQLCGINVFAFYSSSIFNNGNFRLAMLYSLGFGMVNFFFCLPSMRTIDTLGRRSWLLATLPIMCLMLIAAAGAYPGDETRDDFMNLPRTQVAIVFIFLFAAAYSPGLGPIPFTLASESFPLSHREAGASLAISVNLFFAGMLTIVLPAMRSGMETRGVLGFFAGMNAVAFILVFLLVEETRWVSLETLDRVFEHPKREFAHYQLTKQVPYLARKYLLFDRTVEKPDDYDQYLATREETQHQKRPAQS